VLSLLALLAQQYDKYWRSSAAGPQFTCFTSTKVQILTQQRCRLLVMPQDENCRHLLYSYNSTNTDAAALQTLQVMPKTKTDGTCFTRTTVQILTQQRCRRCK
jgi:hypothetical protein